MNELGHRSGDGPAEDPVTEPNGAKAVLPDAVLRADLRRARQAVLGGGADPDAVRFANRLARAVTETPAFAGQRVDVQRGADPVTDPGAIQLIDPYATVDESEDWSLGTPRVSPALRDAVFGGEGLAEVHPQGDDRGEHPVSPPADSRQWLRDAVLEKLPPQDVHLITDSNPVGGAGGGPPWRR